MIPINKPIIGELEIKFVLEALRSGILTGRGGGGPFARKFEEEFAKFVKVKYALATSSGTAALHMALVAAGVGRGDEVIVPSFTFTATAEAVVLAGGKPVFVDIDPETYNIDVERVREAITERTKAIIPVDLYGLPADLKPLMELAEEKNLVIIEDAAQAHGAEYYGRRVGSISHMTCFSFYATKNMTTGEGGMVTTNIEEFAEKLKLVREHGESGDYLPVTLGHNYRMMEVAAAIGRAQLKRLSEFLGKRRENAIRLTELISGINSVKPPVEPRGMKHSWYLYTIRVKGGGRMRDKIVEILRGRGVGASIYYKIPLHKTPFYSRFHRGSLTETERAAEEVLSLPIHPEVNDEQIEYIARCLREAVNSI